MKKFILSLIVPLFLVYTARAQTTAMDFEMQDCEGVDHHLFDELDEGSVVVISFVMMNCSSCIDATHVLRTITDGYAASNPNRVKLYSFGYLDSYTCAQMLAWRGLGAFIHPVFTGGQAQTDYYGGAGMPTIVVLGTDNHTVLYRKLGFEEGDQPAITAAIDEGLLYNPNGINDPVQSNVLIYPVLVSNQVNIKFNSPETGTASFVDVSGHEVRQASFNDCNTLSYDVSVLEGGVYILNLYGRKGRMASVKILKY
jgi:hypothetical protein